MKTSFPPDTPYDSHDDLLTLTELKEQAFASQDLGLQIVNLTERQLRYVPLEGELRDAIIEARRLTHRGALTRQLRFIGKIIRKVDTAALQRGLEDARSSKPYVSPLRALATQWAKRLSVGHEAIGEFLTLVPQADRTRLSQLIRQQAKNSRQNKADAGALLAYVEGELASIGDSLQIAPDQQR